MSNPSGDAAIDGHKIRTDIVDTFGLSGFPLMRPLSGDSKRTILGFFLIAALAIYASSHLRAGETPAHLTAESKACAHELLQDLRQIMADDALGNRKRVIQVLEKFTDLEYRRDDPNTNICRHTLTIKSFHTNSKDPQILNQLSLSISREMCISFEDVKRVFSDDEIGIGQLTMAISAHGSSEVSEFNRKRAVGGFSIFADAWEEIIARYDQIDFYSLNTIKLTIEYINGFPCPDSLFLYQLQRQRAGNSMK